MANKLQTLTDPQPASKTPLAQPLPWHVGRPLEPVIIGGKSTLSPAAKEKIRRLSKRTPFRFVGRASWTWLCMLAAIALAAHLNSTWVSIAIIIYVGTRQNVLAVLMHEQVHRLAFLSKSGDTLCNLAIAYPLLVTLEAYRRVHIAHHQNYFTERDPDYARKQGPEWTFPQTVSRFLKTVFRDLLGLNALQTIKSKRLDSRSNSDAFQIRPRLRLWVRTFYYAAIAAALIATGTWPLFLLYWLVPLLTVMQLIVRWAAICEHKYDLVRPDVAESTPFIQLRWWETLLLPNLNFTTYHIYHHFYPQVPCANLPEIHNLFENEGLVNRRHIFKGFGEYLRFLFAGRRPTGAPSESCINSSPKADEIEACGRSVRT